MNEITNVLDDKQIDKRNSIVNISTFLFIVIATSLVQNYLDTANNHTFPSWLFSFIIVSAIGFFPKFVLFAGYSKLDPENVLKFMELVEKHPECKKYAEALTSIGRKELYELDMDICEKTASSATKNKLLKTNVIATTDMSE